MPDILQYMQNIFHVEETTFISQTNIPAHMWIESHMISCLRRLIIIWNKNTDADKHSHTHWD